MGATKPHHDIRDNGAKGDGITIDTDAIQDTVNECAHNGGGKVIIPPGRYLTGPIFLKSHVHVELIKGSCLMFHPDIKSTPVIEGRSGGIRCKVHASLFTGLDLEDISITGGGLLDGQGEPWWIASRELGKKKKELGIKGRNAKNPEGASLKFGRPKVINLYRCKNVHLGGFKIINSPSWTIHPVYCENVSIDNISIHQPYESPNTDGIDLDSCNTVRITNCFIDCGDDCIAIKSGFEEDGRKVNIPCKNIIIANNHFANGRAAVAIGSETAAGVKNVTIHDCIFNGTFRGLRIKTKRGRGGMVENIIASNIIMERVDLGISLDMVYGKRKDNVLPVTEKTPHVKNITYSNITGTGLKKAADILGLPESPMDNVTLENIYLESETGLDCSYSISCLFRNVEINAKEGSAFNFRRVNDFILDNIKTRAPNDSPVMYLEDVDDVIIRNCKTTDETLIFIKQENSTGMELINNSLGNSKNLN